MPWFYVNTESGAVIWFYAKTEPCRHERASYGARGVKRGRPARRVASDGGQSDEVDVRLRQALDRKRDKNPFPLST